MGKEKGEKKSIGPQGEEMLTHKVKVSCENFLTDHPLALPNTADHFSVTYTNVNNNSVSFADALEYT